MANGNDDNGSGGFTRRQVLKGAAAGLVVTSLTVLETAQADGKSIKVGLIMPNYNQFRWKNADQKFFRREAQKMGMKVLAHVSNQSVARQTNQVENLLTQGIDVLVLAPVNADQAKALVYKANAANVPVVDYNFLIKDADVPVFLGRDSINMGERIAKAAVDAHPKGNYILALGDEGTSVAVKTRQGFMNILKPRIDRGDIKIVSDQYNQNWSPSLARAQVANALTQNNNDVTAVLCGNDGTATGAIRALQDQSLAKRVFVTGIDASPHAQKLIKQGLLDLSNFTVFSEQGRKAAHAALALAKGQSIDADATINNGKTDVPWIKIRNLNVTQANIAEMTQKYPWWFDQA